MINIGEVCCHGCGDWFEPEGVPNFDEPNVCWRCEKAIEAWEIYNEARYGSAAVFE